MHSTPSRAAERAAATRAQLIAATIGVLNDKSFHGTSVFEVAKAAGFTPGALQHHFGSKAELMMQVLDAIVRGSLEGGQHWPRANRPLAERADAVVRLLWKQVYGTERFLAAWQVYFGCLNDTALRERVAALREPLSQVLHERFHASFPELASRRDAVQTVDLVLSSLRGLGMLRLFGATHASLEPQLATLSSWFAVHLAAAPSLPARSRKVPRR